MSFYTASLVCFLSRSLLSADYIQATSCIYSHRGSCFYGICTDLHDADLLDCFAMASACTSAQGGQAVTATAQRLEDYKTIDSDQ